MSNMALKNLLSEVEVKHVAKLAKLGVTDEEIKKFGIQLTGILELVNQLTEVDTHNIIPTSQVTGLENIFREDVVIRSLSQNEVLANAPDSYRGFFRVKAVLDE